MRKSVLVAVCLVGFATVGFAQDGDFERRGEKGVSSVGGIVGYAIDNKTPAVGVDFRYNLKDRLRLAPSVLHTVKNEGRSAWFVNADAHYLARITNEVTIYPIGGIGLSAWKLDPAFFVGGEPAGKESVGEEPAEEESVDGEIAEKETKVRAGLNLGFGGEMRVTKDLIVGAEFRYHLTPERLYDQAMILARVAYYF
jgi:outer membrane protein X